MKVGILVTGPNASGKTTALQNATMSYARDKRLKVVYADNSDRSAFKGEVEDMTELLSELWLGPSEVFILEGTRMPTVLQRVVERHPGAREVRAFVTVTTPPVMEAQIRARCSKLGKRYRDDYWDERKLAYEGQRRYRMSVPRFIEAAKISWWEVDETYAAAMLMQEAIYTDVLALLGSPQLEPEPPYDPQAAGRLF